MELSYFPAFNAALNATSAFLLICGYIFIRQHLIKAHTMCMAGTTAPRLVWAKDGFACYILLS